MNSIKNLDGTANRKINSPQNPILIEIKELNLSVSGEEAMWKAVIFQALVDATSRSNKREEKIEKANAISWLSGKSPDFKLVCSLAGFELGYLQQKIGSALRASHKWKKNCRGFKIEKKF